MISMIAAMGNNNVIGKDGDMPWHLPNDLKYFKKVTTGHPVLMGRKTFESIGKPLPNRKNYVLTRNKAFAPEGVEVLHSIGEVRPLLDSEEEFFVIGGAHLYNDLLPLADRLYITHIKEDFTGDTFFPEIEQSEWKVISSEDGQVDEKNIYAHTFVVYERK
ncbi:dihydrofolate reductase [Evansella vedderi]|uniref:Dihydrofolate reductase n=1 Tax=Evansella vedderi TaxID=38282 RepID=A0ABU0A2A4_9BACI|nr:dihydrofolate reductase [Evansella vedderi]MDQ0257626.1 dihydrofolate reductase [Evansella vedderi]